MVNVSCPTGLIINENEFLSMPQKERDCLLYRNQLATFDKLDTIQKLLEGYKFNQKVQYAWLATITAIGTWIFTKYGNLVLSTLPFLFVI